MEIYISALLSSLSPQVVFALIGGIIGVGIKSKIEGYSWGYTIFIAFGSLIACGATAEYLLHVHGQEQIFIHMFIAVIIGIIGASMLHAVNIFAPKYSAKIVNLVGGKISKKIDNYLE